MEMEFQTDPPTVSRIPPLNSHWACGAYWRARSSVDTPTTLQINGPYPTLALCRNSSQRCNPSIATSTGNHACGKGSEEIPAMPRPLEYAAQQAGHLGRNATRMLSVEAATRRTGARRDSGTSAPRLSRRDWQWHALIVWRRPRSLGEPRRSFSMSAETKRPGNPEEPREIIRRSAGGALRWWDSPSACWGSDRRRSFCSSVRPTH